jgi:hypothetical protein
MNQQPRPVTPGPELARSWVIYVDGELYGATWRARSARRPGRSRRRRR